MNFKSNGKILLTGEYLVLKGAKALALPLNLGQQLKIEPSNSSIIKWSTFELKEEVFKAVFKSSNIEIIESNDNDKAKYIQSLLLACKKLNSQFLAHNKGYNIEANIHFNMQWGLGTSSTLITNLAQWAQVNAFKLNNCISKGSGYDIACASANNPITYQLVQGKPSIKKASFNPNFIDHLNLVYLNTKMATENNIKNILSQLNNENAINELNLLTESFLNCKHLSEFIKLLGIHEGIISNIIGIEPVKDKIFNDFQGGIKSLGAWGGDFILAASELNFQKQQSYFNNKGYKTVIPLKNLMLK